MNEKYTVKPSIEIIKDKFMIADAKKTSEDGWILKLFEDEDVGIYSDIQKIFAAPEVDALCKAANTIDNAIRTMNAFAPKFVIDRLGVRNNYALTRYKYTYTCLETSDSTISNENNRWAVLNLIADILVNIDQALYDTSILLCPGTENNLEKVIRPALIDVRNMFFEIYDENGYKYDKSHREMSKQKIEVVKS